MVRIAGLLAAGHDRVLPHAVPLHQLDVDQLLDPLRCQWLAVQPEHPLARSSRAERLMRGGHRLLGRALRGLDVPDLLLGFDRAALEEGLLFRLELVAKIVQAHGMGDRKSTRLNSSHRTISYA